ncbi:MAG: biotin--[acetyl-CoA-carboxylase] ligase [Bryobacteraceae bacterium]
MPLDLAQLRARMPGRQVVWFESTGSTMLDAGRLAAEGAPSGTIAVAEEQTAGQGRHGRAWISERDSGLYPSFVLRCELPADSVPVLALALGLAVREAILDVCGIACDLRWPNDLLADGKKCVGILVQSQNGVFIAGIGINVNQQSLPAEISGVATSLRIVSRRPHSREELLIRLARAVDEFCRILVVDGKDEILRLYTQASSYASGRRVVVDDGGTVLYGTTEGLDPSGFLILRQEDGTRRLILTGGVRPA